MVRLQSKATKRDLAGTRTAKNWLKWHILFKTQKNSPKTSAIFHMSTS